MRVSDWRRNRINRENKENSAFAEESSVEAARRKLRQRIDMDLCRKETVHNLTELIITLEEEPVASRLRNAVTPILSSSRNPYGMIIAFEFKLRELNLDEKKWEVHLNALKQKTSSETNPNNYY